MFHGLAICAVFEISGISIYQFFILMFGTNSICYQRPKAGYET
jgi:hypothetical protein